MGGDEFRRTGPSTSSAPTREPEEHPVSEPTQAQPGEPCWIDLLSSDTDRAEAFYGALFGWTAESAGEEYGGYINFSKDGTRVAGCMRNDPAQGMPDAWAVYLASADAEATVDAATANGGGVMLAPMEVPAIGVMAYVTDPGGAAVGLFQATGAMSFGYAMDTDDTPGWFELWSKDYDSAVGFYQKVFGWDTETQGDTPEFRYTTLGHGEAAKAGVMDASGFLPEGVPSHWSVYFRVADTDASVDRAVGLGGAIVVAPEDTPYGRLATLADPNGAVFKLLQPPA
jgi:hypothetical protein